MSSEFEISLPGGSFRDGVPEKVAFKMEVAVLVRVL